MRELKPLRADTYDTSDSVYARNNAFTQSQIPATTSTAASGSGSGRVGVAGSTGDLCEYEYVARDQSVSVGHTENRPDLVRRIERCQCTTARYSNVDAKTALLARKASSEACSSTSSSRDGVVVEQQPVTSLRVCHHCGYASLTETVQQQTVVAPGSGTLPRRVVSTAITTTHCSASVTLPRRQLQSHCRTQSPPPPLLPRKKL